MSMWNCIGPLNLLISSEPVHALLPSVVVAQKCSREPASSYSLWWANIVVQKMSHLIHFAGDSVCLVPYRQIVEDLEEYFHMKDYYITILWLSRFPFIIFLQCIQSTFLNAYIITKQVCTCVCKCTQARRWITFCTWVTMYNDPYIYF